MNAVSFPCPPHVRFDEARAAMMRGLRAYIASGASADEINEEITATGRAMCSLLAMLRGEKA